MELIHTCYRILDIDRSVAFYRALGFEEVARLPIRDEAINVFMNMPGDGDSPRLELTYNIGREEPYELGTGYGHVALAVDDLDATLVRLAEQGIEPEREPYRVREGGSAVFRPGPRRLPDRADRPNRQIDRSTDGACKDELVPDPATTDPDKYTVVFENHRVRVLEYRDEPGSRTSPHVHPDSVMVTLSAFDRRLIAENGEAREVALEAAQVRWLDAQTHSGETRHDSDARPVRRAEGALAGGWRCPPRPSRPLVASGPPSREQAVRVPRRALRREARVRDPESCVSSGELALWRGGLVDAGEAPRAVLLELPRARTQEHARPVPGAHEGVLRLGRAVDEVPLLQRALLPLDDQQCLAGEDEEVLLLRLPAVGPGGLSRAHDPDRHAEHREERLGLVLVVARERDAVPLPGLSNQRVSRALRTNQP